MAKFIFKAKKGPKQIEEGIIEAENEEAVQEKLAARGYIPVKIILAEKEPLKKKATFSVKNIKLKEKKLSKAIRGIHVTLFTEQFFSLVKSKLPILEAVNILYEQTENISLKRIILNVYEDIKEGSTLAQALIKHPKAFPQIYVNMIKAGEAGGVLEETLERLVEFRNKEEEIKSKVISALAYPLFMIMVGVMTVVVLLTFVIPRLTALFVDMEQSLPLPTQMLISLSEYIRNYWFLGIFLGVLLVFVFKRRGISRKEKIIIDGFKLKIPLIGDFIKKTSLSRFSRTLSMLLRSGIPLFEGISESIPIMDNEVFKLELDKVKQSIIDGSSLEQSLKKTKSLPSFMINILVVGEKGGRLNESLIEIANFYERDVDRVTKIMTSLIEPAIILIMGVVVGFIVFAMVLPIFQMNMG
ncbi:MAG: type II secretion system F family protein [Candidatus Omnitrophica bacterium]|nr:type II secretion system F family protein [Candidatus Omnitrophota bacterium]MCK5492550.1 type II secretion system F family protein [Candidatus Omnitrophota bacterium]